LLWNCEGLKDSKENLNLEKLREYDIVIFNETMIVKEQQEILPIPGFYYKVIHASKKDSGRPFRGTIIYYNAKLGKLINHKYLENFIILNFEYVTIVGAYLHPNMKHDTVTDELLSTLQFILHFNNLIFAGDFNCRMDTNNPKKDAILDFMGDNNLALINDFPYKYTYICHNGGSVVDLIFVGRDIKPKGFKIIDLHKKKHRMLGLNFKMGKMTPINCNLVSKRLNIDEITLKENFDNNYKEILNSDLLTKDVEKFNDNLLKLLHESEKPKRVNKRVSQPWFDTECYQLKNKLNSTVYYIDHCVYWGLNEAGKKWALEMYAQLKRVYKNTCHSKKLAFQRKFEEKILREAEDNKCYRVLHLNKNFDNCNNIAMNEWENNFELILNEKHFGERDSLNLDEMLRGYTSDTEYIPIMQEEIKFAIRKMKNGKAPGPDSIRNENLKSLVDIMLPEVTEFLNLCVMQGRFPIAWRHQNLKLLFKGKGDVEDVNAYRGISLSSTLYNLLDRVLHNRLYPSLIHCIPNNQYGFVRGKSTVKAVRVLVNEINEVVYEKKTPLYAMFLDLRKAFDTIDRVVMFKKLVETKKLSMVELKFLAHAMDLNFLHIKDGVTASKIIVQSNGVRQGGCTSPFFFNFAISDINEVIKHLKGVKMILYADDMVLLAEDLADLREAIRLIKMYLQNRNLKLNLSKCEMMKFRNKGKGKYKHDDEVEIDGVKLKFVSEFTYLGVIFQSSGICFTKHIEKRARAALIATYSIKQLYDLSIETAMKLFELKISPIASYGIEVIWPFLSKNDLEKLERVKTRYLKKVLGLSKFNWSRYVYELVDTDLFVSDLKEKFSLSESKSYENFYEAKLVNKTNIRDVFYEQMALTNVQWQQPCFADRNVFTRFVCHGYHYLLCKNKTFHYEADATCLCQYCGLQCSQYHIKDCKIRSISLREAAKMRF
jgi:hypothetical protein